MRKKAFILFLASLLLIASCPAVYADEQGGKNSFTVVKDLPYDSIGEFSEGMALVEKHDNDSPDAQYGYIDTSGKLAIPFMNGVVGASDFSDGLAAVKVADDLIGHGQSKFGYIDKSGALVIPYQYSYASDFANGAAVVVSTPT